MTGVSVQGNCGRIRGSILRSSNGCRRKRKFHVCTLALLCRPGTWSTTRPSVLPCHNSLASSPFPRNPPHGNVHLMVTVMLPTADNNPNKDRRLWRLDMWQQEEGGAGSCHSESFASHLILLVTMADA